MSEVICERTLATLHNVAIDPSLITMSASMPPQNKTISHTAKTWNCSKSSPNKSGVILPSNSDCLCCRFWAVWILLSHVLFLWHVYKRFVLSPMRTGLQHTHCIVLVTTCQLVNLLWERCEYSKWMLSLRALFWKLPCLHTEYLSNIELVKKWIWYFLGIFWTTFKHI